MTELKQFKTATTLAEIVQLAKLTEAESASVREYIDGKKDSYNFYGTPEFEKLFEYFGWETGEMPYGIAKCRTGEPDVWILDRLSQSVQIFGVHGIIIV